MSKRGICLVLVALTLMTALAGCGRGKTDDPLPSPEPPASPSPTPDLGPTPTDRPIETMGPQLPIDTPTPTPPPVKVYGVTTSKLNFRPLPTTNTEVIKELPVGFVFEILEERSSWYRTEIDNQVGWVSAQFVNLVDDPSVTPTNPPSTSGRVIASSLHIRSGPGSTYESVGGLDRGDTVTIAEERGGWLRITHPRAGWVSAQFIQRS